jgi:enamidase
MPLGMIKTVAELASLAGLPAAQVWAMATGNNARQWNLPAGFIREGADADLVVLDAPWGSVATDAIGALNRGDIPGISAVVTSGVVRALLSRNTPRAARLAVAHPPLSHLAIAH